MTQCNYLITRKAEIACEESIEVRKYYPSAYLLMRSGVKYIVVRNIRDDEEKLGVVDYIILSDEQMSQTYAWKDALNKLQRFMSEMKAKVDRELEGK